MTTVTTRVIPLTVTSTPRAPGHAALSKRSKSNNSVLSSNSRPKSKQALIKRDSKMTQKTGAEKPMDVKGDANLQSQRSKSSFGRINSNQRSASPENGKQMVRKSSSGPSTVKTNKSTGVKGDVVKSQNGSVKKRDSKSVGGPRASSRKSASTFPKLDAALGVAPKAKTQQTTVIQKPASPKESTDSSVRTRRARSNKGVKFDGGSIKGGARNKRKGSTKSLGSRRRAASRQSLKTNSTSNQKQSRASCNPSPLNRRSRSAHAIGRHKRCPP